MKKQICALLCLAGVLNATEPLEAQCSRDDSKDIVVCKDVIHGTLIWQDGNEDIKKEWKEAKEYCNNLNYAGYTDWRLPTKTELLSIVDYTRYDPAINKAFKNGKSNWCWSSTPFTKRSSTAWNVNFSNGGTDSGGLSNSYCVRCVRQ